MANHGMVCVGATLEQAMALTEEIEFLCRVYALSRAYGEPQLLDCAQNVRGHRWAEPLSAPASSKRKRDKTKTTRRQIPHCCFMANNLFTAQHVARNEAITMFG